MPDMSSTFTDDLSKGTGPVHQPKSRNDRSAAAAQIHCSFVTHKMDVVITSDLLQWVFKRYGNVENVVLKKYQVDEAKSVQSGYGFVYFSCSNDAILAVRNVKNLTMDGITYDCDYTHQFLMELKQQSDQAPDIPRYEDVQHAAMFAPQQPEPAYFQPMSFIQPTAVNFFPNMMGPPACFYPYGATAHVQYQPMGYPPMQRAYTLPLSGARQVVASTNHHSLPRRHSAHPQGGQDDKGRESK